MSAVSRALDKIYTLKEYAEDDPEGCALAERERFLSEWKLNYLFPSRLTEEENDLMNYEQIGPDLDIADPFGGPLEHYGSAPRKSKRRCEIAEKIKNRRKP